MYNKPVADKQKLMSILRVNGLTGIWMVNPLITHVCFCLAYIIACQQQESTSEEDLLESSLKTVRQRTQHVLRLWK